jgi:hypothetical protein
MSFFSSKSPPATPTTGTSIYREAPGIEERKIELMDIARQVAQDPITLPDYKVAGLGALEQQGLTAAGTTGIGAPTVTAGINQIMGAAAPVGQSQINQYLNPYQSYVTDEIGRQAQIMQNQLGAKAIGSGAFGGGREGVQQAELQGRALSAMGQANQQGFNTALGAAQRQQQLGLAAGQQLGQMGLGQQQMAQGDINQLFAAGGVAGPKSQSGITMGTAPSTSPLAQAVGTGIGAFTAFQGVKPTGTV